MIYRSRERGGARPEWEKPADWSSKSGFERVADRVPTLIAKQSGSEIAVADCGAQPIHDASACEGCVQLVLESATIENCPGSAALVKTP